MACRIRVLPSIAQILAEKVETDLEVRRDQKLTPSSCLLHKSTIESQVLREPGTSGDG